MACGQTASNCSALIEALIGTLNSAPQGLSWPNKNHRWWILAWQKKIHWWIWGKLCFFSHTSIQFSKTAIAKHFLSWWWIFTQSNSDRGESWQRCEESRFKVNIDGWINARQLKPLRILCCVVQHQHFVYCGISLRWDDLFRKHLAWTESETFYVFYDRLGTKQPNWFSLLWKRH